MTPGGRGRVGTLLLEIDGEIDGDGDGDGCERRGLRALRASVQLSGRYMGIASTHTTILHSTVHVRYACK